MKAVYFYFITFVERKSLYSEEKSFSSKSEFPVPWANVSSSDKMDLKFHERDKINFEKKYLLLIFWLTDELVVFRYTNLL